MNSLLQRTLLMPCQNDETMRPVFIDGIEILNKRKTGLIGASIWSNRTNLHRALSTRFYQLTPYQKNNGNNNATYALKQGVNGQLNATKYYPCSAITVTNDGHHVGLAYHGEATNAWIPAWISLRSGKKFPTVVTITKLTDCEMFQSLIRVQLISINNYTIKNTRIRKHLIK